MKTPFLIAALLTIPSAPETPNVPGAISDEQLLQMCSGERAQMDNCRLYIAGVRAGMSAQRHFIGYTFAIQPADSTPERQLKLLLWMTTREPFCSEKTISDEDLASAFVSFEKRVKQEHPESVGKVSGGVAVLFGGQHAFACTKDTINLSRQ